MRSSTLRVIRLMEACLDSSPEDERDPCLLIDLDGTLASAEWRRPLITSDPKLGWQRFFDAATGDRPSPVVRGLYESCRYPVVLVSARPERWRYPTEWWLMENGLDSHDRLIMRPSWDGRPDPECKHDLLHNEILPRYRPVFAVDDRPHIAEVWRGHGIPALVVTDPALEPRP